MDLNSSIFNFSNYQNEIFQEGKTLVNVRYAGTSKETNWICVFELGKKSISIFSAQILDLDGSILKQCQGRLGTAVKIIRSTSSIQAILGVNYLNNLQRELSREGKMVLLSQPAFV